LIRCQRGTTTGACSDVLLVTFSCSVAAGRTLAFSFASD
jgi:hypothetical protein